MCSSPGLIGLNLAKYLQDLGFHHDRSIHSVDSLRGYADTDYDELLHRLKVAHPRPDLRRHALTISSVASSGSLASRLRDIAQSVGFSRVDGVALYAEESARLDAGTVR